MSSGEMLTLQPQHAFRRSVSSSRLRSLPRRRSLLPSSSSQPAYSGLSSSSSGALDMQRTSPPLFIKYLPPQQELPAILLHPCLAPEKFIAVCCIPAILANLVQHIQSSRDFLSFIYPSKQMRALVGAAFENDPTIRHRFFARFLPGYPLVSRAYWNPRLRIDLTDLELFLESEAVPLSNYPRHALSNSPPSPERHETTMRFQTLTLTHSRFILYLRSRSNVSVSLDEDEHVQPSPVLAAKELTFPAPLSYPSLNSPPSVPLHQSLVPNATAGASTKTKRLRRLSIVPMMAASKSLPPPPAPRLSPPPTLFSSRRHSRLSQSTPRMTPSMFDFQLSPPSSFSHRRSHSAQDTDTDTLEASRPSDGQPTARFSFNDSRPSSHLDSPPSVSLGSSAPSLLPVPTHASAEVFPSPGAGSLHSLTRVFWQARAPILRVFVPCSALDEATLHACMVQLTAADLHKHLVPGDLAINFGYVPEQAEGAEEDVGWMIYDGERLVPLTHCIPIYNPTFTLPSPFYYSHVLPPTQNPRYVLTIPRRRTQAPMFSLGRVSWTLASVTSPTGRVRVNLSAWLARIEGSRWGSEWILEAEGTKEGRAFLDASIASADAGAQQEWELVREKSGRGRIWLRRVLP